MNDFIEQYKKTGDLHHFYVLVGNRNDIRDGLGVFFEDELSCPTHANPLYIEKSCDRLLIDDVKKIVDRSFVKTEKGKKMVFCLSFNNATLEAQNALLKVIEEPSESTFFFLVVPRADTLIPTVLSRAFLINAVAGESGDGEGESVSGKNYSKQISLDLLNTKKDIGQKMKIVDGVIKKIKEKKIERGAVREIVKNIIIELEKDVGQNLVALKSLQKLDSYAADPGSSAKLLLEKVVLSISK